MPVEHPPEFRRRAVALGRLREKPVAQIAEDLGISDSCLRNWMVQADRDEGRRKDGVCSAEREELVRLRRELRVAGQARGGDPQAGGSVFRPGERAPKMFYTFIAERCSDLPVSVSCRVMKVSTSESPP